jgi:phosphohistidine phosphatase
MEAAQARKIVLFRHAKSAWPDVPDHERPLANRGRRAAPAAGRWLAEAGIVPDMVLCSTARRARETWELAGQALGGPAPVRFETGVYQASAVALLELLRGLPAGARTVIVVGHDPSLPDLAVELAAGQPGAAGMPPPIDRLRAKFPTAAIALLEFTGSWPGLQAGRAHLTAFVTPRDIAGS